MVDETLILRKLAKLDEYLGQIREYSAVSLKEYEENWKVQRIIDRTLQITVTPRSSLYILERTTGYGEQITTFKTYNLMCTQ